MRLSSMCLSVASCLLIVGCSFITAATSAGLRNEPLRATSVDTTGVVVTSEDHAPDSSLESRIPAVALIGAYLDRLEAIGFQGAVLVELNGREALARGYGYSDSEARIRNTPETVFDIGSLTKQFTAAAIMRLQMLNKLELTDSLSRYFEQVPSDKTAITIHDLLRHRSGLPSNIGKDYEQISEADFVTGVMRAPLQFRPGQSFGYSNIGYSLLGLIIEKASGMGYEAFLSEHLLKPAGLESTGYSRPRFDAAQVAVGYHQNGEVWGRPTTKEWGEDAPYWHLTGNGGLLSNVRDLYAWHRALQENTVLTEELSRRMYHPNLQDQEDVRHYYAYGWDVVRTRRNTRVAWHNGMNGYFYADLHRYLDEGMAVIVLSNRMHPNFDRLGSVIARMIQEPDYAPLIPVEDNAANRGFSEELMGVAAAEGSQAVRALYDRRHDGVDVLEFVLQSRGFDLLGQGEPRAAVAVFELNLHANPKSARAMQALAEAYMETGQTELAIRHFEACLALDPENSFAIRMLERLRP